MPYIVGYNHAKRSSAYAHTQGATTCDTTTRDTTTCDTTTCDTNQWLKILL
jgi:hypothetical protein